MNNIVTLSQLITRLAKTTGTDTTTARIFLRSFFAEIEQRLVAGETVSIKGIGTFHRPADPLVGDHNGVAFIPDPEMQAEVNRRFSAFQPVELADEVDETELLAPEPSQEPEEEVAPAHDEEPVQEPIPEPEELPEPIAETIPEPQPEPQTESQPEPEQEVEPVYEQPIDESFDAEEKKRKNNLKIIIILGVFAVLIIGAGLFLAIVSNPIPKVGWDDEEEIEQTTPQEAAPVDTDFVVQEVPVEEVSAQEVPAVQPPKEPEKSAPEATVYDTVGKKYYLTSMARKYYGSHLYWVYIYEANKDKLRHPDRLAPGTKVAIPPKSSIPSIDNEPEARRLAEAKAKEIYARFK